MSSGVIVNIIELQNTITSASGLTPIDSIEQNIAKLLAMVDVEQNRIFTNSIGTFNSDSLELLNNLNLGTTTLLQNDEQIVGGVLTGTSTIFTASTFLFRSGLSAPIVQFTGGDIQITGSLTADSLRTASLTAASLTASTLSIVNDGFFGGNVYAQAHLQLSDRREKINVTPLLNSEHILSGLHGRRFRWLTKGTDDIGCIAQEVYSTLPEAVVNSGDRLFVNYEKIVPVLIEAVKDLSLSIALLKERVALLEQANHS